MNHAQYLEVQIGLITMDRLQLLHFALAELDSGEDKRRSCQCSSDRTQRIKGLGEIEPPFRRLR